jgi:hypothetical protein
MNNGLIVEIAGAAIVGRDAGVTQIDANAVTDTAALSARQEFHSTGLFGTEMDTARVAVNKICEL